MSRDELRDRLAELTKHRFAIDRDLGPLGWEDEHGVLIGDHPFPDNDLNALAAAWPKGKLWDRTDKWRAYTAGFAFIAAIDDTGNEYADRLALTVAAWEHERGAGRLEK